MYNGIGLRTVRGSGTNGFVQRNRSYVAPPPPQQLTHAQQRDVQMRAQLQITKKANSEMLEHERKRRIEIKVAEFEEQLRSRNFTDEEIEQKCNDARIALTEQMRHTADEINLRDSHQASAAKEKENARLRAAFGIREDRPAGAAFAAMNDKGKKGEEKDAPTEDKPLRLPRSYLDRTIEKREGEEEDEENPRRKRQRSRSPQREGQGQGQERERERDRGGREREDVHRRDDRDRRDLGRGDRLDYGDNIRRSDDRDRRDRRDERSFDDRRRDRRDIDEDRYRPRERSRSPFDGQPKMRDDGRDEGEPRSVIVAEPEPEQEKEESKKETEKGEEVAKEKSDDKKREREREREREKEKEKEKDKDKGKDKDKSSSRSKKRSKRSDSSSDSSSSDSDSDSSSSSDSDDDRRKKDSKRKRSPSQD